MVQFTPRTLADTILAVDGKACIVPPHGVGRYVSGGLNKLVTPNLERHDHSSRACPRMDDPAAIDPAGHT